MGFFRLPLLWRVFTINAVLLLGGTLVLVATRGRVHASTAAIELVDLVVALVLMLVANLVLLRRTLSPIDRLVERMRTVDLLRPGQRLAERGGIEVVEVVRTFNEMLDRLETERRDSSRRALAAQESERLRISRGLHDEIGQVLTGVLLHIDSFGGDSDDRRRRTDETRAAVRQALEEVRRIAQELRPALLEHLGLVSALTELSRTFAEQSGIRVERSFAAALPPLSTEAELALYRVTQESLTNVARHAGAQRVELVLEDGGESVVLRVLDDGHGMTEEEAASDGNGGLRGMRERAVLVGGALAIKPRHEGGIEVRLEVPAETS